MTRKDYELLAGVFVNEVINARELRIVEDAALVVMHVRSQSKADTLQTMAYNLVQKLSADNERFDHKRFYGACGFNIEHNYPVVFPERG